jgi:hypothetical protein
MSRENVEIVRRAGAFLIAEDWEGMSELVDPDVELRGTVGGLEEGYFSRGLDRSGSASRPRTTSGTSTASSR